MGLSVRGEAVAGGGQHGTQCEGGGSSGGGASMGLRLSVRGEAEAGGGKPAWDSVCVGRQELCVGGGEPAWDSVSVRRGSSRRYSPWTPDPAAWSQEYAGPPRCSQGLSAPGVKGVTQPTTG